MSRRKTILLDWDETPPEEMLSRKNGDVLKRFLVQHILYSRLDVEGKPPMMKVTYFTFGSEQLIKEVICVEHCGELFGKLLRRRAEQWWAQRSSEELPMTIDEALQPTWRLREPAWIVALINTKYPSIVDYFGDFGDVSEVTEEEWKSSYAASTKPWL